MVYWGCSTGRNRCVWAACAMFALAAVVLLCAGAGRMWVCNHSSSADLPRQEVGPCRVRAGILIALCPVVLLVGVLPSLLFFQSCCAEPPPQPVDWDKDVPASGITVVRRTSAGAAVYRYDSQGRLLQAPDCYRSHMARTPPSPALSAGGQWGGPNWLATEFNGGDVHSQQQQMNHHHHHATSGSAPGSPAGRASAHACSSSGGLRLNLSGSPYSIGEETATAEVYICLSPLSKGPSGQAADKK